MNSSTQKTCRNCATLLPADAKFCSNCSQKYTTGRVPFKSFLKDFVEHYFNLDSRFFRTMSALFVPGKLTKEYFLGKHRSYSKPLQLFLVPAFFLFALISWNISNVDFGDNLFVRLKEDIDWITFYENLEKATVKTDSVFQDSLVLTALDTLTSKMKMQYPVPEDSLDIAEFDRSQVDFTIPVFSKKDLLDKSSEELVELYAKDKTLIQKVMIGQATKFKKGARGIVDYLFGKLSIIMLLMMPIVALMLKLLYIRHDYFYVEHLIFTLHLHAFVFMLASVIVLFLNLLPSSVSTLFFLVILLYLFFAMKKVYQQGIGKTLLKFSGLIAGYFFSGIIVSTVAIFISFLLF